MILPVAHLALPVRVQADSGPAVGVSGNQDGQSSRRWLQALRHTVPGPQEHLGSGICGGGSASLSSPAFCPRQQLQKTVEGTDTPSLGRNFPNDLDVSSNQDSRLRLDFMVIMKHHSQELEHLSGSFAAEPGEWEDCVSPKAS